MKSLKTRFALVAAVALVLTSLPALAADEPSPEAVENATTAADHNSIAEAYEAQAKEYRESAERHERLTRTYGKGPRFRKQNRAAIANAMSNHCERVSASFKAAAEQSDALAKSHRQMAAETK